MFEKTNAKNTTAGARHLKDNFLRIAAVIAHQLLQRTPWSSADHSPALESTNVVMLLLGLHVCLEEQKLNALDAAYQSTDILSAIIAQLGQLLGLEAWTCRPGTHYFLDNAGDAKFAFVDSASFQSQIEVPLMAEPVGIFQWFEHSLKNHSEERYPTIDIVAGLVKPSALSKGFKKACIDLTPFVTSLSAIIVASSGLSADPRHHSTAHGETRYHRRHDRGLTDCNCSYVPRCDCQV